MEAEHKLFLIQSHGIGDEQCPPEANTTDVLFDEAVTGLGENEAEAYEDALEQIAMGYGDDLITKLKLRPFWGDDEHDICEDCVCNGDLAGCDVGCEVHYYVSIYFNEPV